MFLTQRERIELIADAFPGHTADELIYPYEDYHTLKLFKGTSDRYYMNKSDYMTVERHVFEANVKPPFDSIQFLGGTGDTGSNPSYYDFRGKLEINGQEVSYEIQLAFSEDYNEATLTKLSIDSEDAFE